jgi:hypothetical protein
MTHEVRAFAAVVAMALGWLLVIACASAQTSRAAPVTDPFVADMNVPRILANREAARTALTGLRRDVVALQGIGMQVGDAERMLTWTTFALRLLNSPHPEEWTRHSRADWPTVRARMAPYPTLQQWTVALNRLLP